MPAFEHLTMSRATDLIRTGQISSQELVEAALQRIDTLDPALHAWVTIDREAVLAEAQQRDQELRRSGPRGPLHGIPIGCKDILYTARLRTTACSSLYAQFVPDYDASAVSRVKGAGAIIIGKTVCTEFATNDPPPTRNAWNRACTPGGSSSGSAVAVATHMCFATLDTQTAGDVLRPAAYNGVVGFKPTYGRISRYGVIPVAWSIDTVGAQTRSVEDAAILLQVLAGHDPADASSTTRPISNYLAACTGHIDAPHIGIVRQYFYDQADEQVQTHTEQAIATLRRAGAHIEEISLQEDLALLHAAHRIITFAECAAYHQEMFSAHRDDYGPRLSQLIELGLVTPAVSYLQAQRLRRRYRRSLQTVLAKVDALLVPATPTVAPRDLNTTGQPIFHIPWTLCGFPAIALPSGLSSAGLPLGIQLVGPSFGEAQLLAVARWCEQALHIELTPPPVIAP